MKKTSYVILFFVIFFSFQNLIFADSKKYANGGSYLVLNKDACSLYTSDSGEKFYQCIVTDFDFHSSVYGGDISTGSLDTVYFYTDAEDAVLSSNDGKWWANFYVCNHTEWGFLTIFGNKVHIAILTTAMLSNYKADDDGVISGLINGENSKCLTYQVQDVDESKQIGYCTPYENIRKEISSSVESYLSSDSKNKVKHKTEYTKNLNYLKSLCNQAMSAADYNDACVQRCLLLPSETKKWEEKINPSISGECGFSDNLVAWIRNIINWVKYIVPVAVIILGIIDFIKAIASEKDDEMKTAQKRFIKRLIAAALIFIIPFIIEFVLDKLGFTAEGCGIIDL